MALPFRRPAASRAFAAVAALCLLLRCGLGTSWISPATSSVSAVSSFGLLRLWSHRPAVTRLSATTKLYDVLGVAPEASVAEIKKAYYREARLAHPDINKADASTMTRFQEVAEAYQTLADPVRRQSYDLSGLAGLATFKVNATRLFGPPPWRVLIGKTDHWLWGGGKKSYFLGLMASSIPNGIAGVTLKTLDAAYDEAFDTNVAILLERVSEEQAKDTVLAIEEYGLAVKAEPIEEERRQEEESPLQCFRRCQRDLGHAAEQLRVTAQDMDVREGTDESTFDYWVETVRELRSELRIAAKGLEEYKAAKGKPMK